MSIPDRLVELLQGDIQSAIEEILCVEAGSARVIAGHVLKRLQSSWGGQRIYIPAGDTKGRDKAIRVLFNGRNHGEVCKKYSISLSHLYRIIK